MVAKRHDNFHFGYEGNMKGLIQTRLNPLRVRQGISD